MLDVEYLVFVENEQIKCKDVKSFNSLLQSDPDLSISKSKITYNGLTVNYSVKTGTVKNLEKNYFHLKFKCSDIEKIDNYTALLRAVKGILHIINKSPQILFDGVSLFYANQAYPLVFEVENLMRKLITKFMLINVGINWSKERVPDDVKNSVLSVNKDLTYLHNVDFIQLKNFLFSENYSTHKDSLIQRLKSAKNITELDLNEIKTLIPFSNWDKYFSDNLKIHKDQLSKKWDFLYDLRCKIAHNRTFSKEDLTRVVELHSEVKDLLLKAIDELDSIEISETESNEVAETVAGNFSHVYGEFIYNWTVLENLIRNLYEEKVLPVDTKHSQRRLNYTEMIRLLRQKHILSENSHNEILRYLNRRNRIVHNDGTISPEEVTNTLEGLKMLITQIENDTSIM